MKPFAFVNGRLFAERVPLEKIARQVGTPVYVYSQAAISESFRELRRGLGNLPHLVCYSVKASSNLALLKLLARMGAGFDIVSGGELYRVQKAGGAPAQVVFSGVGKTENEIVQAARAGILMYNVESAEELEMLDRVGRRLGKPLSFALRVNPDVDAKTHPHIATGLIRHKFGIPLSEALTLYEKSRRLKGVVACGVDGHIGSQITEAGPIKEAIRELAGLYRTLCARGFNLRYLDVGGGLGISYRGEKPPSLTAYASFVRTATAPTGATVILEPGRALTGNAGLLLTRVLYRKKSTTKNWVIVDAGSNDFLRPALYDAYHEVCPIRWKRGRRGLVDVAGPLCESSDVLALDRKMALPRRGEFLAIMGAGAYGMCMASNYNSRLRPAEVLVSGSRFRVVRQRETYADLIRGE